MTRRSNITEELHHSEVLAEHLINLGYENHRGLRWWHPETGRTLSRMDLSILCQQLDPEAPATYLRSERFFNHLFFAALRIKRS